MKLIIPTPNAVRHERLVETLLNPSMTNAVRHVTTKNGELTSEETS